MDFTGIGALTAVLAALGGVVKLVLDALNKADERHNNTLSKMQEQQTAAIKEMQERQEKFLGNHMSSNTKAMERVAEQLAALTQEAQSAHLRERERERYRTDEGGRMP